MCVLLGSFSTIKTPKQSYANIHSHYRSGDKNMTSLKKFPLIILFVVGLSEAQSPLFVVNKLTSIGRQAHDSGNIIIQNLPGYVYRKIEKRIIKKNVWKSLLS